jgi:nucleoside-diphosphate-sugar epimerase
MRNAASDPAAEFRRVNVEGTRLLLEESIRAGVRTFVFFSSVKAMTESSDEILTEATPPQPTDPYGCSKLEAERVVSELAEAAGISAPILRLPLVYGPGMRANVLELFRVVDRGVPLPFGSVRNSRSLVYVGNVVAAVEGVLSAAPHGADVFLVSDSDRVSTPELIRHIGAALDRRVRILSVPVALLRAAGRIGDLGATFTRMPITSPRLERLLGSLAVDSSKLARAVPQWPPYTLKEGLRSTARWFRASANERVFRA